MRVLVCPDKFAGTLSADAAARAIASGWRRVAPEDHLVLRPLADGGPGFLDVMASAVGGRRVPVDACDPLRRSLRGELLIAGDTAYIESAQTCGLHLLDESERDPLVASSYGLGLLIGAAIDAGVGRIVVGLGGSATIDCGAGMLSALGAVVAGPDGTPLPPGGGPLIGCARLTNVPDLRGLSVVAAADVAIPLLGPTGAAHTFGPQKGASPDGIDLLERALQRFAYHLRRSSPACPADLVTIPGAGASGGLAAAIVAMGGRCSSGAGIVWETLGLDGELDSCDLVITGEGRVDAQTLHGKLPMVVTSAAAARGVHCVLLAGQVAERRGVTVAYSVAAHVASVAKAISEPVAGLEDLASALARSTWIRWSAV